MHRAIKRQCLSSCAEAEKAASRCRVRCRHYAAVHGFTAPGALAQGNLLYGAKASRVSAGFGELASMVDTGQQSDCWPGRPESRVSSLQGPRPSGSLQRKCSKCRAAATILSRMVSVHSVDDGCTTSACSEVRTCFKRGSRGGATNLQQGVIKQVVWM